MESTFADLRSKYDTPRPSTSNIKMAWPQSQPHDIDMSTFNGVDFGNEVNLTGTVLNGVETSRIRLNFWEIRKIVLFW